MSKTAVEEGEVEFDFALGLSKYAQQLADETGSLTYTAIMGDATFTHAQPSEIQSIKALEARNVEISMMPTLDREQFRTNFTDIIETVCKRPKMYMMNGTFGEALAFLDGYANGRNLGERGRSSSYFNPYRHWLQNRLNIPETEDFWRAFRDSYPDDGTALKEFARLWHEYERTSERHPNGR